MPPRTKFQPVIRQARFDAPGISPQGMLTIGHALNNSIAARMDKGLDVFDATTAPLTTKYQARKRIKGGSGLRDMKFTGRTRRGMQPLSAAQNVCVIGFSDPVAQERMKINNRRYRQYGVSPSDSRVVLSAVSALSERAVTVIGEKVG